MCSVFSLKTSLCKQYFVINSMNGTVCNISENFPTTKSHRMTYGLIIHYLSNCNVRFLS